LGMFCALVQHVSMVAKQHVGDCQQVKIHRAGRRRRW
jgi:hypothetical protein